MDSYILNVIMFFIQRKEGLVEDITDSVRKRGTIMVNIFEHDAVPTWSGFVYQGRIAVCLAIKKIIELKNDGKILEIDKYAIDMIQQLKKLILSMKME